MQSQSTARWNRFPPSTGVSRTKRTTFFRPSTGFNNRFPPSTGVSGSHHHNYFHRVKAKNDADQVQRRKALPGFGNNRGHSEIVFPQVLASPGRTVKVLSPKNWQKYDRPSRTADPAMRGCGVALPGMRGCGVLPG